jgi:predicted RNase H-like nuclease (RuvC/YqgF family)
MNEKSNLNRDIQHLLDELDNLRARETAIETQFIRERDEIKGHYEFEKIDLLRQYHDENSRMKAQLDDEKRRRKQLEDEIEMLRRKLTVQGVSTNVDTGSGGNDKEICCRELKGLVLFQELTCVILFSGRGDVNVSLGDDNRRRDYLEEENKKLLYQINLLLSKKDGGGDNVRDTSSRTSSDSSDDVTRLRRKLAVAEEERDKFERMKKDLEYEMDRYKSKCDTLQTEVER